MRPGNDQRPVIPANNAIVCVPRNHAHTHRRGSRVLARGHQTLLNSSLALWSNNNDKHLKRESEVIQQK